MVNDPLNKVVSGKSTPASIVVKICYFMSIISRS